MLIKKVAVILSGCGVFDGAEIRESVLTLLSLDNNNIDYEIFAPDRKQHHVINHLTQKEEETSRNILIESARVARGNIKSLDKLIVEDFAAIIMPGGFGVAKNFSDLALKNGEFTVESDIQKIIEEFYLNKKPICAMCISPAIIVKILAKYNIISVTIGNDNDGLINKLGGNHIPTLANNIAFDEKNIIITTAAYMLDAKLNIIAQGIEAAIKKLTEII